MRDKDRKSLHAASYWFGLSDRDGNRLSKGDVFDRQDWHTFLLAKDMYSEGYSGPDWVPFSLWSTYESSHGATGECARKLIFDAGAHELWCAIEATYRHHPNSVAIQLPMECVLAWERWSRLSKRTPAKHRDHMLRMKANAIGIANEIDKIEALEALDTGERFDFMKLYNEEEKLIVYQNVAVFTLRNSKYIDPESGNKTLGEYMAPEDRSLPESPINRSQASNDAGPFWELLTGDDEEWPGITPTVSDLMRRLAKYFDEASQHVPIKRPAFENAERNYFVRHLCLYFRDSFGFASPTIIARIASVFYPQGIDDNEVSQVVRKLPGGNRPQEG